MKEKEKDIFDKIMALPGLNIFEGFYQKYKEMLLYLFFWRNDSGDQYRFLQLL